MAQIRWLLEKEMFDDNHTRLADAIQKVGHTFTFWQDEWWDSKEYRSFNDEYILFHGSLNNASRIIKECFWSLGAFCDIAAFSCSKWYPEFAPFLIHEKWKQTTVVELVSYPDAILKSIGGEDGFFVRPDSPLKPFSGRVLTKENLSLEALDYGFYYDDKELPIIVTPLKEIREEWRFVIVDSVVITGSSYEADGRAENISSVPQDVWDFAQKVAANAKAPEDVYVLDICEADGDHRVLEINPFSGADLYNCDREKIVSAIDAYITGCKS